MKNRNFTKKHTNSKTINSNNSAKFEVNWPRGPQFTARHTKNRLVCRAVNWEPLLQFASNFVLLLEYCRRFFVCRAVNWEPLRQFTSNFVLLLELIVFTDFSKDVSELAKGSSIYSATYKKSPTVWWIKSHNSGMKIRNFTIKYTDHKTINSNKYAKFEVNCPRGSQFTAWHKKSPKNHFSNFRGGARNFWGISCKKSRFYAKKIIFLPILGGTRAGCALLWIRPC
jgi:transposase-like protein